MKQLMAFVFFGFFLTLSQNSLAQFAGCHQWCGNESNKAWWGVLESHGLGRNATATQKAPYIAEADAAKEAEYDRCMAQTIAEGKRSDADCNGATSSTQTPNDGSSCQQEYNNLVQQCDAQLAASKTSCDENQNSALRNLQSSASSTNTSTSGVTDSCSTAGSLASSAKNAWTSYRDQCDSGMQSCHNACNKIIEWANSKPSCLQAVGGQAHIAANVYSPKASQCLDLQAKVDSANKNVASYGATSDSAAACKTDTAGGESSDKSKSNMGSLLGQAASVAASMLGKSATATPQAVVAFCTANPSYPGCGAAAQASCSDPTYAATNRVCQCAANPRLCGTTESASTNANGFSTIDSSSRLPSQSANVDGDIPNTPNIPMGPPGSSGDVQGIDGRQGGAPVGSSTVGSGLGGNNQGKADVNPLEIPAGSAGTFGGSGEGGGRPFKAGTSGNPAYRPGSGSTATANASNGSPDLRKFLPGGMYNPRQNMIGGRVGIDGITGPNSNIWQKVQNRYQVLKDTLHP